jgi:uncharacterized protein YicC (UPF0701 family)
MMRNTCLKTSLNLQLKIKEIILGAETIQMVNGEKADIQEEIMIGESSLHHVPKTICRAGKNGLKINFNAQKTIRSVGDKNLDNYRVH